MLLRLSSLALYLLRHLAGPAGMAPLILLQSAEAPSAPGTWMYVGGALDALRLCFSPGGEFLVAKALTVLFQKDQQFLTCNSVQPC